MWLTDSGKHAHIGIRISIIGCHTCFINALKAKEKGARAIVTQARILIVQTLKTRLELICDDDGIQ
jgi:hypothetical protein